MEVIEVSKGELELLAKLNCDHVIFSKKSFCYKCFKNLPRDLQNDLYLRMGDGYEQAYDAAVKVLEDL